MAVSLRREKSDIISENLIKYLCGMSSVGIFYPMASEPDIVSVISYLLDRGTIVSLPVIRSVKERRMDFVQISSLNDLVGGTFGIMAPSGVEIITRFDAVVVPTVGVNSERRRLGMGGGFYDTYFGNSSARLVAPLYHDNVNLSFVHNQWDVTIDTIITEISAL